MVLSTYNFVEFSYFNDTFLFWPCCIQYSTLGFPNRSVCTIFIVDLLLGAGIQKYQFGSIKKDYGGMKSSMSRKKTLLDSHLLKLRSIEHFG